MISFVSMMSFRVRFLCLIFLTTAALDVFGQSRVAYRAKTLENFKENKESVRKLTGNVVFTQKSTRIYCDSALFYKQRGDLIEAFGRVRIVDDSTVITAKRLNYEGANRKAELRENVVYQKGYNRLTTDNLDYQMDEEISTYFGGGELRDTTNILTSQRGTFYAKRNYASFEGNVVLKAPDYLLKSNELQYNTLTKIAVTPGKTEIISNEGQNKIDADGGEFRTDIDQSLFVDGKIETPDNFLEGEDLFFDDHKKYYKAVGDVKLTAKDKDVIIIGEEGYYDKQVGISKIFGQPIMKKILETDTFYVAADTMISIESEIDSMKRVLAYNNVRIFKTNLQGRADSSSFFRSDSIIVLYKDPILWTDDNQVTSDTIKLLIGNEELKEMYFRRNAFMISTDTLGNFNQIKGRNMTAFFKKSELTTVEVDGNGESVYYALEKDSLTMGLNRILCSNMKLRFKNKELRNISFYTRPSARFIPPHQFTPDVRKLNGFKWREEERPFLIDLLPAVGPTKTEILPQGLTIDKELPDQPLLTPETDNN